MRVEIYKSLYFLTTKRYKLGITKSETTTEPINPKITATDKACSISAPLPSIKAIGRNPPIVVIDVIKIGLTLRSEASITISLRICLFCLIFSIKLTTKIPLFTTIPKDIIRPINADTLKVIFVILSLNITNDKNKTAPTN